MTIMSKEQKEAQLRKAGVADPNDYAVSFDEIESFGDRESLVGIVKNIASYNKMLNERITLINQSLTEAVPFTKGSLYLFCAYTGSGKSTVAANITYPLWKENKKILVISNEEPKEDILFRIACLEFGYNFNDWKNGEMSIEMQKQCMALFPEITQWVKILDVTYKDGLTTKIEGIKSALTSIRGKGYSCVLIDYYQLIKDSIKDRGRTRYDVLNDLRIWLGQYIKTSEAPVCLFVQLYSLGKKGGVKDIDARIKECSAVVEPATVIFEIVPNRDEGTSDFIIHKDRFGVAGNRVVCPFKNGRYLMAETPEEAIRRQAEVKKKQAEENLNKLTSAVADTNTLSAGADYDAGKKI